jgi:hypothetical protein
MSAPHPCAACGDLVRQVVDVDAHEEISINADQVAASDGNVVVVTVAGVTGLWLVEIHARPGPPGDPEQYRTKLPPPLWQLHVCPLLPAHWPAAAIELEVTAP